jgi:hypothetical protein
MFRGRRERAIRERGRPAVGEVRSVRRSRGSWIVLVSVTPDDGELFDTHFRFTALGGVEPRVGDLVEVLHSGRDAVPMEDPPRFRTPAPVPDEGRVADGDTPPSAHDVIGQLLRRLADGSLLSGGPQIVIDDAPGSDTDDDGSQATIADLVARAADDPDGVADEILRRVVSGEASFTQVLDATRAAGSDGTAAARAVLGSLRDRGLLGPAQHAALTRMVG